MIIDDLKRRARKAHTPEELAEVVVEAVELAKKDALVDVWVTVLANLRRPDGEPAPSCEDGCAVVNHPRTPAELALAYEHWRWHGEYNGCSHGR